VYADNHFPVAVGAEAVKAMYTAVTSQFSTEFQVPVDEVRVAGDLAVARGTWTITMTPKAPGLAPIKDRGSWMLTASRHADGSWKWDAVVPNSDQALPGATSDGAAEQAIATIENSFGEVMTKGDVAAAEQVLANEWVEHSNGGVTTRAQVLGAMKSGAVKVESATVRDLRIAVFGDAAVATMTMEVKGSFMGKPFPGVQRGTDFFVKRDGRWQIVNTQNTAVQ
jgi:ketosteroid isomerase-like protein